MSDEDFSTDERLKERNTTLLAEFTNHLILQRKLGKRKAHAHASHLEFYGNEYLWGYHSVDLLAGHSYIGSFFGDWFIRKAMWSDEAVIRANVVSFGLFYEVMRELGHLDAGVCAKVQKVLMAGESEWIRIARRYEDPDVDFEDVWGGDMDRGSDPDAGEEVIADLPASATPSDTLRLNLLLSAKVAKFLGLKAREIQKTSDFGSDGHHWTTYWRCEECFLYEESDERGILVTNLLTRYSFFIDGKSGDPDSLVNGILGSLVRAYQKLKVATPSSLAIEVLYCGGSSPSLCGSQSNSISLAHTYPEEEVRSAEELERRLNAIPTKMVSEYFPDETFATMLKEDPPFNLPAPVPEDILPFLR